MRWHNIRMVALNPADAAFAQPDDAHEQGEEPSEEMIARRSDVKQGDGVLGQRRGRYEPQPRIKSAAADEDIEQNSDAAGVQRHRRIGFRGAGQPARNLQQRPHRDIRR